ncbi:hypothetical protein KAR91_55720 [Candidatus Pacearchaeota archaeon]|nr:hypothetical protein [Candidatus Pacearchaeota archaeon]
MEAPANIRDVIQRINTVTADGPRFGCQFSVEFEGIPEIDVFIKSFSYPAMKGSEAEGFVQGVSIPLPGVKQFGGNEGFPCMILVKRGGKQQAALLKHFYSGLLIPKVKAIYVGPGETAAEGEIIDFYGGKITVDPTSYEDDANTENLTLEGEFKYLYWLTGE